MSPRQGLGHQNEVGEAHQFRAGDARPGSRPLPEHGLTIEDEEMNRDEYVCTQ